MNTPKGMARLCLIYPERGHRSKECPGVRGQGIMSLEVV
jgi:hypothetical protein